MDFFHYKENELFVEDVSVTSLAKEYKTPLYIYSAATLRRHFKVYSAAFAGTEHLACYSVKANSNLSVLRLLGKMGAGVDIVSGGELYRALRAGITADKIIYSGVGKSDDEIRKALDADILMFNVESRAELKRISELAEATGRTARISFRINPDVDPKTHPYIATGLESSKFGLDIETAVTAYAEARGMPGICPIGIDFHIGSQITTLEPFAEAVDRILKFYATLCDMGLDIQYLDIGGGLGITYKDETAPQPEELGKVLKEKLQGYSLKLLLEPGRSIAGNAGILVTKVYYTKTTPAKNFVIIDAAMNDLIRPALYSSHHSIVEVCPKNRPEQTVDIVGPVCESGDFLAKDRLFPQVESGEYLAVLSAGAYGFTMSSNYNSRPRAAEIMVDGKNVQCIRHRETYEDLIRLEI